MSEKKENVPKLRFPGFTDDWERRKLGEIYTERNERGYDSLQILTVSIHHGISSEELDSSTLGKKVRRSEDKSLYKHVYSGDLVLNMMRAWQGAIGVVKSEGMVSPAYITSIPSYQIYPLFMDYCLRRDEMISQIDNLSYGVTDFRKRIYWDSFINVSTHIPSVPEQVRITDFFTQLDNLISLQQRKLNNAKKLKTGLLQKMFPKDGEDFPEVRFPGFTDAWEQRKAKDLFNPIVEKGREKLPVLSVTQELGVVYRKDVGIDIKYDPSTLKDYKVIHPGDFVISLRSFQGGFELSDKLGISSPAYTIFNPKEINKHDNFFWKTQFKTFKFIESLKTVTFGIRDGKSISFSEFGDLVLHFPSNKDEQIKIGAVFTALDKLITLNQRKLEHLQQQKKALFQQMFV